MRYSWLIVGLTTLLLDSSCALSELIVKVNEGLIKGRYAASKEGKLFAGFTGIPYAEPPLGPLRFKAPVPKKPWDQVKDTTKPHAVCPQRDIYRRTELMEGEEDCLFLNVYTPKLDYEKETKLLPVMLFIHGGGFLAGSAVGYPPETLMDREVVLVVINYRLGALGFLTTGDEVCPGNNGLKDQSLAIKWTKNNIKTFGGDPGKITLFGESAGGASVNYHMLSPLSQNLFQAGISESGTAVCSWSLAPEGEGVAQGKKLGRIFNCPTENSASMVECLRKVEPMDFIAQDTKFMKWDTDPMIPFKPCIEPKLKGAFISSHPLDIMKSGKVPKKPWMTGVNTEDGALRSTAILANPYLLGDLNDEFNRLVPIALLYDKMGKNVNYDYITKKIRKFYFGKGPITKISESGITDMFTDGWFMAAADQVIRNYLKYVKAPVYYYLFGYRGTTSLSGIFGDPINDYGVCHADELQYLFPIADELFPGKMQQPDDLKMAEVLTTLWVNFAKTGKPTPKLNDLIPVDWTPVQSEDMEYYFIGGPSTLNMTTGLYLERARFWREILDHDLSRSGKDEL